MTQNNETAHVVTFAQRIAKLDKALERGLIDKNTYDVEKALEEARESGRNAAQTVEEVTIGFKVKESNGEQTLHLDAYSSAAVIGGYDAIRIGTLAKSADDATAEATAIDIVEACKPRALEAGKALVADAGKRATECMRPGGKSAERERMALSLKGALKAYRVAYAKGKPKGMKANGNPQG